MKLGTHNSLSYHRPQWWLRWLNFTAKCQDLTIEEQYALGVRYFDFRIKFTNKGVCSGHGLMTYKVDFKKIFSFLEKRGDCIVNLVLENHFWQGSDLDIQFSVYARSLKLAYPHIQFVGGYRKRPWTDLLRLGNYPVKACYEFFEGKNLKFPYPKYYAKKKNPVYWQGVNDEEYSMFDFIEIGHNETT